MTHMTRRHALAALGSAGLGGLLAACSNGDDPEGAASTTTTGPGADDATTSSTAAPSTSAGSGTDLASMFEEAGSCQLSPEETEGPYYMDVDRIRSDIRDGRPGA